MFVTIELRHGPQHNEVISPEDLDAQIEMLKRLAKWASAADTVSLIDTASILEGIKASIRKGRPCPVPYSKEEMDRDTAVEALRKIERVSHAWRNSLGMREIYAMVKEVLRED